MAYATAADIDKRVTQAELVRITDEYDLGVVDPEKVAAAIEAADLEIDSYLGHRYTLPLAIVPAILTSISVDLALWNLYSIADADGMPKTRQNRRDNAIALLAKLSDGTITLGASDPLTGQASFSAEDRIFTRTTMGGLM